MDVRIPETPPPPLSANVRKSITPPPPLSADVFYEQPLRTKTIANIELSITIY